MLKAKKEMEDARAAATAVRSAAADAAAATKAAGAEGPEEGEWDEWDDVLCHRWEVALAEFEERCAELNARIDDFNLVVPGLWQQLPRVTLAPAVIRAIDEAEALLAARRAAALRSGRRRRWSCVARRAALCSRHS